MGEMGWIGGLCIVLKGFWGKKCFGRKNSLFYGDARARLRDGGARARFKKNVKNSSVYGIPKQTNIFYIFLRCLPGMIVGPG